MARASQEPGPPHPDGAGSHAVASKTAIRQEKALTALSYVSMGLAFFVAALIFAGAIAYFASKIYGIKPRWMFGLFD